jgi:hypothetical protein
VRVGRSWRRLLAGSLISLVAFVLIAGGASGSLAGVAGGSGPFFSWSSFTLATRPHDSLNSLSCSSASFCVAVDADGYAFASSRPTSGPRAWQRQRADPSGGLDPVSCAGTSVCVAFDGEDLAVSDDPAARDAGWHVVALPSGGENGNAVMTGVSCPSVALCVVGDDSGDVITSSHPSAATTAWRLVNLDDGVTDNPGGNYTSGVSCPSATFCVIADENDVIFTSSDPLGGASAWRDYDLSNVVPDDGHGNDLAGLVCPSRSFCLAGDVWGDIVASSDPTGGEGDWWRVPVTDEAQGPIDELACATVSLCLAVDQRGDVLFSSDSASRADTWRVSYAASRRVQVASVSCPTPELCLAVATDGTVLVARRRGA